MKGMHLSEAQKLIRAECREVERILLAKNAAYGNSALQPLRIFSKADPRTGAFRVCAGAVEARPCPVPVRVLRMNRRATANLRDFAEEHSVVGAPRSCRRGG